MNVIQKFYDGLPQYWRDFISDRNWFDLSQFNGYVWIQFEDGSHCFFNYAFMVIHEEREELAVFTEHCGYYVFSTRGLENYRQLKFTKPQKWKKCK